MKIYSSSSSSSSNTHNFMVGCVAVTAARCLAFLLLLVVSSAAQLDEALVGGDSLEATAPSIAASADQVSGDEKQAAATAAGKTQMSLAGPAGALSVAAAPASRSTSATTLIGMAGKSTSGTATGKMPLLLAVPTEAASTATFTAESSPGATGFTSRDGIKVGLADDDEPISSFRAIRPWLLVGSKASATDANALTPKNPTSSIFSVIESQNKDSLTENRKLAVKVSRQNGKTENKKCKDQCGIRESKCIKPCCRKQCNRKKNNNKKHQECINACQLSRREACQVSCASKGPKCKGRCCQTQCKALKKQPKIHQKCIDACELTPRKECEVNCSSKGHKCKGRCCQTQCKALKKQPKIHQKCIDKCELTPRKVCQLDCAPENSKCNGSCCQKQCKTLKKHPKKHKECISNCEISPRKACKGECGRKGSSKCINKCCENECAWLKKKKQSKHKGCKNACKGKLSTPQPIVFQPTIQPTPGETQQTTSTSSQSNPGQATLQPTPEGTQQTTSTSTPSNAAIVFQPTIQPTPGETQQTTSTSSQSNPGQATLQPTPEGTQQTTSTSTPSNAVRDLEEYLCIPKFTADHKLHIGEDLPHGEVIEIVKQTDDGTEVSFQVSQEWRVTPLNWVAILFEDARSGLHCEKAENVEAGALSSTFSAVCVDNVAMVQVFAYDQTFSDASEEDCKIAVLDRVEGHTIFPKIPLEITSQDSDEVSFSVKQVWSDCDAEVAWMSVNYPKQFESACETEKHVLHSQSYDFTTTCTDGIAEVTIFVHDEFAIKEGDKAEVPDSCQASEEASHVAGYHFILKCSCDEPERNYTPSCKEPESRTVVETYSIPCSPGCDADPIDLHTSDK